MFNRNKPYGKITPPWKGAHYEQDGVFYDQAFQPVGAPRKQGMANPAPPVAAPAATKVAAKTSAAVKTTKVDVAAQAADVMAALKEAAAPATPKAAADEPADGEVDLAAWGRGQVDYLFADVAKAITAQFHRKVTTEHDAIDTLIEERLITAKQARKA